MLPDTGVPAANLPMNYGNQFDVQNGYQSSHFQPQPQPQPQPQLPPMPPMPSYGYPSTMPDQMVDFGRTTVDPSQLSVYQQNTTDVENSFGEGEAEGTSPNDEEDEDEADEDEADEEEADGSDVDTGDFVVPNTNGSTNVEKPGITREDNGHLEWQHPKTGRWRKLPSSSGSYQLTYRRPSGDPS